MGLLAPLEAFLEHPRPDLAANYVLIYLVPLLLALSVLRPGTRLGERLGLGRLSFLLGLAAAGVVAVSSYLAAAWFWDAALRAFLAG